MKKREIFLTLALIVVAIFVVSASYNSYVAFRNAKNTVDNRHIQKLESQIAGQQQSIDLYTKKVNDLEKQCLIGIDIWNKLPASSQKVTAKPDCNLSFNQ